MSRAAVVTDSSAQLTVAEASRAGVTIVPLTVTVRDEAVDETDVNVDDFYALLAAGAEVATSLPSPGRLLAAYRAAAEQGATAVVSVHLDGRLSGTVGAARLAASEAPLPVRVVDCGTASLGVGICALEAARVSAGGGSLDEVECAARRLGTAVRTLFVADPSATGRLAGSPAHAILALEDGAARVVGAASTLDDASDEIAARITAGHAIAAAVGHAHRQTAAAADRLADSLAVSPAVESVVRYRVSPSVGAHTGARSFGVVWWPARTR
jgi:fatty acid-binding protein DegV